MSKQVIFMPPGILTPGVVYPVREIPDGPFVVLATDWPSDVLTDQYGDALLDQYNEPMTG